MDTVLETAPYTTECIACGSRIEATVVEVLAAGAHRWDLEGNCPDCGSHWNECGYETPLAGMRAAILAANGLATMHLVGGNVTPAVVMRALRTVRTLTLIEARALADELGNRGLEGTRVEMEALAAPLRAAGASIRIQSSDVM
ncbi:hypothetical protein [Nocardia seriolae]|uniref:Ribosomal protein L7/L12 C-terminal domain-containing protein n=1 Tax=Nocardia seriolae TaxID=37332 RepID=A0A0B8NEA4_9NOCA|nr:hypothetical protein [Nocardia seriolae]MTJ62607.1 hypothetical protein [Nocardia seriolae]MTJ71966.1 hypothetical protein [Nocardia seriolae]MTJ87503.1 hypothetical protein [Nocardia seriolae]MTK31494.1 hypothetical protein [Nocardia seriolae]MTK42378.1 hypothetical protein [Nocardia seriolae]